ncbi:hypothetical protein ELQ35_18875 [Peribacillus cavernae]|uniref:Uncharacterized protein n=1 Tax=Peribacillus cavernae TaxID=1674310 RepID=A0A3S0TWZ2_9BACI|nr:hypothetical protein [Peribacillus cavernae]MDQ0219597.1 hypothetical protein [Peribacillus cavernae]RUQ25885.1 hypothetical protein ELQ35_18875 [Peribacillus cavernae]
MGLLWHVGENQFPYLVGLYGQNGKNDKQMIKESLLQEAQELMNDRIGIECLFKYAPSLDQYGFFSGGPWENASKLQPQLVRGTLAAGGKLAAAETISNLRMLAVATGLYISPYIPREDAKSYLDKVLTHNLDILYQPETEEMRIKGTQETLQIRQLFEFIFTQHSFPGILTFLTEEIKKLSIQRPIITSNIEKLIASGINCTMEDQRINTEFHRFESAVTLPSELSRQYKGNYVEDLAHSTETILAKEAEQLSRSMHDTGLVSKVHVHFITFAVKHHFHLVGKMLGLSSDGFRRLNANADLVKKLIEIAIKPHTKQSVYGLSRLLERDIFTADFTNRLEVFIRTVPVPEAENKLKALYYDNELEASVSLLAGIVSVLGQPLGIGQGFNPCCQSTRALSYWAQKDPVFLLDLLAEAVTNGNITCFFEGITIDSCALTVKDLDYTIPMDSVSVVLVPPLHAIYEDMIKRIGFRGEDIHKVINPAFHRSGVLSGFADKYHHDDFSDQFQNYYHPAYSNTINSYLPQPAGIVIYDQNDQALGAHAILIQRIGEDPEGNNRVYFYNPNNDSSQTWGSNIKTSVTENGELEGESSLLFADFLTCLYAFHYPE